MKPIKEATVLTFALMVALALCSCTQAPPTSDGKLYTVYHTEDISKYGSFPYYGSFVGDTDVEHLAAVFKSMFPAEITPEMKDICYQFSEENGSHWSFELYLEVTMENLKDYHAMLRRLTERAGLTDALENFPYDESYDCYPASLVYGISTSGKTDSLAEYAVTYSASRMILSKPEENRIIIWALELQDGATDVMNYMAFFDRFSIDPREFSAYCHDRHLAKKCTG